MTEFQEFLEERLEKRGEQSRMALKLKLNSSTISAWRTKGAKPDFERCILLAAYWNISPIEIFRMTDRPEFETAFKKLFPERSKDHLTEEDLYPNKEHAEIHRKMQQIIEQDSEVLPSILSIINLWEKRLAPETRSRLAK